MHARTDPRLHAIAFVVLAWVSLAPHARAQAEMADLQEDVRGLTQKVNDLSLRVEQLERENAQLRAKLAAGPGRDTVTVEQLNGAVADLNASIKAAVEASQTLVLERVARQMEVMAKQTNAALDSLSRPQAPAQETRTAAPKEAPKPDAGTAVSKDGVSYMVVHGDSLGLIAKKTGGRVQDIIDANHIADPSKIQAGQVLFIPGGHPPQ